MHNLLILIFLTLSINSFGQDLTPKGKNDIITNHSYYSLSYSEKHEQAEWVMYSLKGSFLDPSISRTNNFRVDPKIKTKSAELNDYRGSGFDRGHLAPAADMKYSELSMSESFYLSNISPQKPNFNRQIWRNIEAQFRSWGHEYGEILIITGPVLEGEFLGKIGSNNVTVPKFFYKVGIDPKNLKRNIAILIENEESTENIKNFVITIDSLESLTGIDFFHNLDDDLEDRIESSTHNELWKWRLNTPKQNFQKTTFPQKRGIQNQKSSGNLFKTKTGSKYHREGCRYLSRSKIPIQREEAISIGLGPCSVCKPPK